MELLVLTENRMTYTNKTMKTATETIYKLGDKIRDNLYRVAYIIATVAQSDAYKEEGYDSVHDWTREAFGVNKTTSYSMLKIGRDYTEQVADGKTVKYRSNLIESNDPDDFTTSQIDAMLSLHRDKIVELVDAEEITPTMSVRDIKKKVKAIKDAETDDTESDETDTDGDETGENSERSEDPAMILTDEVGNKYAIPMSVCKQYEVN